MNTDFQTEIYENTRDAVGDHAATEWKPHVLQADGTVLDGNGAVVEMAGATTDSVKQFNKQNYYDSLGPDDIVFLSRSELGSHKVKVYYTPQDELFYKATAGGFEGQVIPVNYYRLLMSLQKNTDYAHNYQVLPETSEEAVENVEIQELMNNAEAYLSNPVKIITTILSGLLFDIHRFLAMSSLGSGFDLNWILDSSIYKWVSDRFVVIAILLVCIITLIRVVRYLLMKRQSLGEVLKDLCAVLLMTALPFLMLSSFIYLFNSTSTNILREASFKTTASQIQMKQTERMNADANVDTELALFREQFTSLKGNYDGLTFMMPDTYNYATKELSYQEVPLTGMLENLKLTWDKPVWYDATGFVEVNESHYDESPFYFFYDYIKAMYIEYYAANPKVETSAMKTVAARYNYGEKTLASMSDVEKKDLQLLEQNFATTKGNFRTMMKDTSFVYGNSILKSNKNKYGGPQLRDLFGFYKFFEVPDSSGASAGITNIHNADYFTYMQQSPAMYYSRTVPQGITVGEERTWTNPALIEQYDRGRSWLYTSKLDPFNPAINTDTGRTAPTKYTPFEEALFNTSERIYQDILDTLDYLPDQLTDETLITMSALLATFRLDETFGMSPQTPIMGSLNMDMLMRTTLIKNVVNMDARVNLMYAMLNDGYGFFAILCVIMFEAAMALLTLVRILIMLSIIITAFTYGILRFTFGKVTESKFLVWGIVGNYVAMIGLHFLTALIVNGLVSMMSTMFTGIFWTIAGLILLMIGTAGIAALHIFLFMFILRDFRNLGGVSIKNAFDKTVHDMTAKAENIKSKVGSALSTVGDQIQNVKHAAVRIAEAGQAKIQSIKGATIQTITGNISSLNSAEGNPVSQNFDIDAEQRGPDGSGSMQGYGYSQQRQQNTRMERAEAKAAAREAKVEARAAARAATNSEKISGEDVSLKRAPRKAHKHVDTSSGEFDYSQLYK
ncbi:MAG: hypothetical protein RSC68_08745 [Acinetobacter sp.]